MKWNETKARSKYIGNKIQGQYLQIRTQIIQKRKEQHVNQNKNQIYTSSNTDHET